MGKADINNTPLSPPPGEAGVYGGARDGERERERAREVVCLVDCVPDAMHVQVCLHALTFMSCLRPWDLARTADQSITGKRASV